MKKKEVLIKLLERLWEQYRKRVSYADHYSQLVEQKGSRVQNDHIAFRTLNTHTGTQPPGIDAIARIFVALGYTRKEQYHFESKHLMAWHYEHEDAGFPRIFISQLEVDRLKPTIQLLIEEAVEATQDPLSAQDLAHLGELRQGKMIDAKQAETLIQHLVAFFVRPWAPPKREGLIEINQASQYAAWTLLHGNAVNHFTAYINEQNIADWPDLEATVHALKAAGIPMKAEFEGEKGSKLRQTSTQAVMEKCIVTEADGSKGEIEWSYAYYELAERGLVLNDKGEKVLFTAFLGDQATNLFEMTKTTHS